MGELTFIRAGVATTIHQDGEVTKSPVTKCDNCDTWGDGVGGLSIRDVDREVLIFLCEECRG
jgi:hypothetical protein